MSRITTRIFLLGAMALATQASGDGGTPEPADAQKASETGATRLEKLEQNGGIPPEERSRPGTLHNIEGKRCHSTTVYYKRRDKENTYLVEFEVEKAELKRRVSIQSPILKDVGSPPEPVINPRLEKCDKATKCPLTVEFEGKPDKKDHDGTRIKDFCKWGLEHDISSGDGWFSMEGLPDFLKNDPKFNAYEKKWDGAYQKMLRRNDYGELQFVLLNYITLDSGNTRWDLDHWYNTKYGWRYKMLYSSSNFKKGSYMKNRNQDLANYEVVRWKYVKMVKPKKGAQKNSDQRQPVMEASDDRWTYAAHRSCIIKKNGKMPSVDEAKMEVKANVYKVDDELKIGVNLIRHFNGLQIVDVYEDRHQPDLQLGDVITSINGKRLKPMSLDKRMELLRSEVKSSESDGAVQLAIERDYKFALTKVKRNGGDSIES